MTRSRPYHKNDQAHVEQKNSTHVRQLLGHERLGNNVMLEPIDELLEAWSAWRNCYTTSFKQIESRREGSKTIRTHEKVPKTPCQRLIDHYAAIGDTEGVEGLEAYRKQIDPFTLKSWIEKRLSLIWKLDSALNQAEADGEIDMEGVARPILQGHPRYAPIALQNRKHDPLIYTNKPKPEPKTKSVTKSTKVA